MNGTEYADQPTVVAGGEFDNLTGDDPTASDWLAWAATIWPHDAEPFFARTFTELWVASASYPQVTYGTAAVLTTLTSHPGRLGPMAAYSLAFGLSARELRYRALAAEAFAALVPADRIPAAALAQAMAELSMHCVAPRWAATLQDATNAGAAGAVVDVLVGLLPRLRYDHAGLNALVELLLEEVLRVGRVPSDPALRTWLAGLSGNSRSAKAAKALRAEMLGRTS